MMSTQPSPKEEDNFTFEYLNPVEGDKSQRKSSGRSNCWNCGESTHTLRDCLKPRDIKSINKNRRIFQLAGDSKRYHEIAPDKYAHLKPGSVSKNLRDALGLGERQLPKHIYRMRSLGYPPGWILEAEVKDNKLYIFGDKGEIVLGEDEDEGELRKKIRYDIKKIIEYPGFNIKPDSKYLKEEERYDAPDFNPSNSKELFVENLGNAEEQYEFTYGEQQTTAPKPIQQKPRALDSRNEFNIPCDLGDKSGSLTEHNAPEVLSNAEENEKHVQATAIESDLIQGTTIYSEETSEFSAVPPLENFKIGVDELLYFQNLPVSSGSFQALRTILSKVKQTRDGCS